MTNELVRKVLDDLMDDFQFSVLHFNNKNKGHVQGISFGYVHVWENNKNELVINVENPFRETRSGENLITKLITYFKENYGDCKVLFSFDKVNF